MEVLRSELDGLPVDLLATRTELGMGTLLARLSILELKRQVRQLPGRRYALTNR